MEKNKMMQDIKEIVEAYNWSYQCDEAIGRLDVYFDECFLMFDIDEEYVECCSVHLENVPEENRAKVLEYMNSANIIAREGHFEMDDEGCVQFKIRRMFMKGQPIDKEELFTMLARVIRGVRAIMPDLYRVARGELGPREAMDAAKLKLKKEYET